MNTLELATYGPVIPVIVLQRIDDAVAVAQSLVEGGVRVLEVTLRTPVALRCIEEIARCVPEAVVGAGTVRSVADARAALAAGARFAVSPGYCQTLGSVCREIGLPLLPGVATASELMQALNDGHHFVKFFPASAAGGIPMLKALAGPFPEVSFCPTGGLTPQSARDYLALPQVKVCGGSWLTPQDAIAAGQWQRLRDLARDAANLR